MSELYELPNGWEWKTLNDIFLIERGGSPRPIKDYITDDEDGINWIKIGDTKEGEKYIYGTAEKIKKEGLKKSRLVIEGDFILSNSMSFGRPYIVKTKGAIHDGWLLMRDKLDDVSKDYFYYLLGSDYMYQQFSMKASGTTVKNLNIDLVKTTNVPLPPLTEQQRIVEKLDQLFEKIDKAIALHQKNIDEADAFMGSAMNEVFGELEEKYGIQSILDGVYIGCRSGYSPSLIDGKVPFIGMSDIDEKKGINTKYVMMDYKDASTGKTKFESNAVLVGKITPCTQNNKTTIVPSEINGGFATTEVYALHSKDNINPYYLNHYMRSSATNNHLVSTMVGATGRQRVPSETIKGLKISIPHLTVQQKVVTYLDDLSDKIERVKTVQKEKMDSLKALKASILDKAFRGEL